MLRVAPPDGSDRRGRLPGLAVTVVAAVVAAVVAVALVGQALRGSAVVDRQFATSTVRNASLDNAFYRCIDIQAHAIAAAAEPAQARNVGRPVVVPLTGPGTRAR